MDINFIPVCFLSVSDLGRSLRFTVLIVILVGTLRICFNCSDRIMAWLLERINSINQKTSLSEAVFISRISIMCLQVMITTSISFLLHRNKYISKYDQGVCQTFSPYSGKRVLSSKQPTFPRTYSRRSYMYHKLINLDGNQSS